MANNRLRVNSGITGQSWVARRYDSTDTLYSTDITCNQIGVTGSYSGTMAGPAGKYWIMYFEGGSTAANPTEEIDWDGTDIITANSISAGSGLDAAGVRAAIGLASANLDTQIGDLPTNAELATSQGTADDATLTQIALVKAVTDKVDTALALDGAVYHFTTNALELAPSGSAASDASLGIVDSGTAQSATATTLQLRAAAAFANDEIIGATVIIVSATTGAGQARVITDYVGSTDTATVDAWTTTPTGTIVYKVFATAPQETAFPALAESYRADGAIGTLPQLLYELISHHGESSISGTTKTSKKIDGTTTAMTFTITLNGSGNPIAITRIS